jgi:cysteinyl-tRNA synthetase
MSKSLGNIRTMRNFLGQYHGEIFKYLVLSVHYRSEAEFSDTTVQNAVAALGRIYSALAKAQGFVSDPVQEPKTAEGQKMQAQLLACETKMGDFINDDFATPQLMAQIFETVRVFNQLVPGIGGVKPGYSEASYLFKGFFAKWGSLLALFQEQPVDFLRQLDDLLLAQKSIKRDDVQVMVDQRWQARLKKDYPLSDELRIKLTDMGIELRDTPQGTVWEVRKGGN